MLYPKNQTPALSAQLFSSPTSEYRATPFWAWNSRLNQATLNRQIDCMQKMGFGGFHMHVRVGLETPYLNDEFMGYVRGCVEKARSNNMLAWLYDEDKWPSGFAGGLVTQEKRFREKYLLLTKTPYGAGAAQHDNDSRSVAFRTENGTLLASYSVTLGEDGTLASYRRLAAGEQGEGNVWYAYLETSQERPWYNLQTYVDTLSKEAIERFVEITHERYSACVGNDFGGIIPAIFTDEPQFVRKDNLPHAFSEKDVTLPYTTDFGDTYLAAYGEDILDKLPELYWELPDGVSATRYRYHDHVAERFAEAFADTVGNWCQQHNLLLTGHMMEEPTLESQTCALGDCMRSYRSFQLPGIDMLCDRREFTTAKQAQSAAHQYGRPGVLSELYGVTNWTFDFRRHKLQGDWQAALGVSVRVPHLYWVSMRGEAKRDYPAAIGHQSPWYERYAYLEDHFARVNTAMTRGKPVVKIGVIHPVESYWLHWGPAQQTATERDDLDTAFLQLTDWLLYDTLDFDFICESLLPSQHKPGENGFTVGDMCYDVVLVPNCETLRASTLQALQAFRKNGGTVIFAGKVASYIDALPSDAALTFSRECTVLPWARGKLLAALAPYRTVRITKQSGFLADNLIYQLREDTDCRWLFVSHVHVGEKYYRTEAEQYQIALDGLYHAELYNTLTGEIAPMATRQAAGKTTLLWDAHAQDSLLVRLTPAEGSRAIEQRTATYREVAQVAPCVPVTLAEPNVLLLDMPAYRLNDGDWRPAEEVLRICDTCKAELHLQNDIAGGTQPWVLAGDLPQHTLQLRYTVQADVAVSGVSLAVEDLETLTIRWNGSAIDQTPTGYYVDEAIQTVALGDILAGENLLEIALPFGKRTTVEACFILGDFGVSVTGRFAKITAPVRTLTFGDWTHQGLAFYGGSVTYHCTLTGNGQPLAVEVPQFVQPVLSVALDGAEKGVIALSPYRVELGAPSAQEHKLDITAYGNRINTFGQLHNCNWAEHWFGPNAWRARGYNWTYEYRLWQCGILKAPTLLQQETH